MLDGKVTVILYGDREHKIVPFINNGPLSRMVSDLMLNFSQSPSVGLVIVTSKDDAARIAAAAEQLRLKHAEFTDHRKGYNNLLALLGL